MCSSDLASLWLSTFLRDKVAWDALRDYAPVSLLVTSPNIIVVHPALPVNTLKELIALAKARPGELNYSTGQAGASAHLAGELFKSLAGVNLLRVAYKGQGAAMLSLITGEAQLSFPNAASVTPFIKAGKVKALAVTSTQPSALAPGLPTARRRHPHDAVCFRRTANLRGCRRFARSRRWRRPPDRGRHRVDADDEVGQIGRAHV